MTSPEQHAAKRLDTPPLLCLNDDLLAEVFIRLHDLADVGRAATTCAAFRRIIGDRSFLRRLRSVHPAPFLGLIFENIHHARAVARFHSAKSPHPSAPYARAAARAADFSFSFLPSPGSWLLQDVSDGRALFELGGWSAVFAVCDPLSRRYSLLPQISGHPASLRRMNLEPFLVPTNDEEAETSFRVVYLAESKAGRLVAFAFSSATARWSSLAVDESVQPCRGGLSLPGARSYACGCFYWKVYDTDKLLVFNTLAMAFSTIGLPHCHANKIFLSLGNAGEGRIGMFSLHYIDNVVYLDYDDWDIYSNTEREINREDNSKCQLERRIRLPSKYPFYRFIGSNDGFLLLQGMCSVDEDVGYFSVKLDSLKIERVSGLTYFEHDVKLCTGFPPSLCLPSV